MATESPPKVIKQPTVQIMSVSPLQAANWLAVNHERNRRLRPHKVAEYAADMAAGRWYLSDQAVSFDVTGQLINGQHRLTAVVKADVTVPMVVLFNAPTASLLVIDGGMKRATDDRFGMADRGYVRGCGATVRRLLVGLNRRVGFSISDQTVDRFMGQYGASVALAHRALPAGRFAQASVRSVLTRAHIRRTPGERLERFAEVYRTGVMGSGEVAAVLLRNKVIDLKDTAADSGSARAKLYGWAESALTAFLAGSGKRSLDLPAEELFPIPRESDWTIP